MGTLISIEDCHKGFNDRELLSGVSLSLGEGERVGLLGRNGSGKSSLLRILAGIDLADSGERVVRRGLNLGYLEQDPVLAPDLTARQVVRSGFAGRQDVLDQLERVHEELVTAGTGQLDSLLARQGRLDEQLESLGGHDIEHRIESTLHSLGLLDFDATCGSMSGGERRRVALARLLLSKPDVLLLDEPTNHLDAFVTDWLEDWFLETRTPLILVTHDRYFLDRIVDRIVELDRGQLHNYSGGYPEYLEARAGRLDSERKTESSRCNLLRRETAWMRRGAPARSTKAKARIHRYEDLVDAEPIAIAADLEMRIPDGPRLGTRVVQFRKVAKSFGDRLILPPLDLEIEPGTRLGIVGPNGAGKTTLLRLLLGQLEPDSGSVEIGETVSFMGIDQMRSELDPQQTVAENVAGASDVLSTDGRTVRVEGFLDKFGFPKKTQTTLVSQLSGGEKNRVLLAKLLCAGGNVLVLDEPTNDLDLATLRALEEALLVFPGAAIVVSHDRWFLDRVATRILYLDGQGGARLHHGDLSSLLEELAKARTQAARAKSKPKPAKAGSGSSAAPQRAKRLSSWEEKELKKLEKTIAKTETEIAAIDEELAAPALYTGPQAAAREVQDRRSERAGELDKMYARWEELESMRS
ncbi:MAG: ATP-binding cassette subfamily F protein uup [Chlamydiales bacterium]|jgi:ATP-binding cassette subfamily F protein uup